MKLTLLVPNLLWPDPQQPEIYHDLQLPSVTTLLSKSQKSTHPPQDIEAWLCTAFDIRKQSGNWPVAPILLKNNAPGLMKTDQEFWMRADPVHLRIEQNHIMLADHQAFQISESESASIMTDLNHYLKNDDLEFNLLKPEQWYVRLPKAPEILTHTLSEVTCKNINHYLPTGTASAKWLKIFNEIQMLLHEHPVNLARESRGELPVNSVWFWGGGTMPHSIRSHFTHIWSQHDLTQSLATASNTSHAALPEHPEQWLQTGLTGHHLVLLNDLHGKAKYRDAYHWRERLKYLDTHWFHPILTALENKAVEQLTITVLSDLGTQDFNLTRSSLWKVWLRPKPLTSFMSHYL